MALCGAFAQTDTDVTSAQGPRAPVLLFYQEVLIHDLTIETLKLDWSKTIVYRLIILTYPFSPNLDQNLVRFCFIILLALVLFAQLQTSQDSRDWKHQQLKEKMNGNIVPMKISIRHSKQVMVNENHVLSCLDSLWEEGDFISVIGGKFICKFILDEYSGRWPGDGGSRGYPWKGNGWLVTSARKRAKDIARVFQDPKMGTLPA